METRDPTREFKASRRNSGGRGARSGKAVKLKAGRDRDRNGRGRLKIFFIYARADTKTSKVSGGKGRSPRVLLGRGSTSDIMRIAREHSSSYADFRLFRHCNVAAFATLRATWLSLFAKPTLPVLYASRNYYRFFRLKIL